MSRASSSLAPTFGIAVRGLCAWGSGIHGTKFSDVFGSTPPTYTRSRNSFHQPGRAERDAMRILEICLRHYRVSLGSVPPPDVAACAVHQPPRSLRQPGKQIAQSGWYPVEDHVARGGKRAAPDRKVLFDGPDLARGDRIPRTELATVPARPGKPTRGSVFGAYWSRPVFGSTPFDVVVAAADLPCIGRPAGDTQVLALVLRVERSEVRADQHLPVRPGAGAALDGLARLGIEGNLSQPRTPYSPPPLPTSTLSLTTSGAMELG